MEGELKLQDKADLDAFEFGLLLILIKLLELVIMVLLPVVLMIKVSIISGKVNTVLYVSCSISMAFSFFSNLIYALRSFPSDFLQYFTFTFKSLTTLFFSR